MHLEPSLEHVSHPLPSSVMYSSTVQAARTPPGSGKQQGGARGWGLSCRPAKAGLRLAPASRSREHLRCRGLWILCILFHLGCGTRQGRRFGALSDSAASAPHPTQGLCGPDRRLLSPLVAIRQAASRTARRRAGMVAQGPGGVVVEEKEKNKNRLGDRSTMAQIDARTGHTAAANAVATCLLRVLPPCRPASGSTAVQPAA